MKTKKAVAILVVVSLIQLVFPVAVIAYERNYMKGIIEKGERYTLNYTEINHFNKGYLNTNITQRYTVGCNCDIDSLKEDDIYHATVDDYIEVGMEKRPDGKVDFFDVEQHPEKKTDYNWVRSYDIDGLDLENYEFVLEGFGMKELFETARVLSRSEDKNEITFEEFISNKDYIVDLYGVALGGKVTLCVYKGITVIDELYIGDELILKHK